MRSSLLELTPESGDSSREKIIAATEQAVALRQSLAQTHQNPLNIWNTSDQKRAKLLAEYLNALDPVCPDPRLIPLDDAGKAPDIKGTCGLDSEQETRMRHTREEAVSAIKQGANGFVLYAGHSDHGTEQLVFADHDDLHTFPLDTLPDPSPSSLGRVRGITRPS
jgi:hypothetical protein